MKQFLKNDEGATSIEYGLIAGFVSISMLLALGTAGEAISALYGTIASQVVAALSSV